MELRIQTLLQGLDLSQNEIKLYDAALRCGQATITQLSKAARIHRVAVYPLVDSLVAKGLLTVNTQRGKQVSATHPRHILSLIADRKREVRKMELRYQEALPQLTQLYRRSTSVPTMTYYEGIQGLRQMSLDVIETMKELSVAQRIIYSYSNPNRIHALFEDYIHEDEGIVALRVQNNIINHAIVADGDITREIVARNQSELRETVVLSQQQFPFDNDITIYENKIAIKALQFELIGVIIESREMSTDQRTIFQLAWAGAQALQAQTPVR